MIYGDNPQKINEREDALGLKVYAYAPDRLAIAQSGNLYIYAVNNAVLYHDSTGQFLGWAVGAVIGGICGAITASYTGDDIWASIAGGAVSGLLAGLAADFISVTGGASVVIFAKYAFAGAASSAAGKLVSCAITGEYKTSDIVCTIVVGAISGALGGLTQGCVTSLASLAEKQGTDICTQALKILQKEIRDLPSSAIEEFLSNAVSWLVEAGYKITEANLRGLLLD